MNQAEKKFRKAHEEMKKNLVYVQEMKRLLSQREPGTEINGFTLEKCDLALTKIQEALKDGDAKLAELDYIHRVVVVDGNKITD